MSMNNASEQMTPCEYIRMVNDMCQTNSEKDITIRRFLAHAEKLAKELSLELDKYDKKYWHRFAQNSDFNYNLLLRKHPKYKFHKL